MPKRKCTQEKVVHVPKEARDAAAGAVAKAEAADARGRAAAAALAASGKKVQQALQDVYGHKAACCHTEKPLEPKVADLVWARENTLRVEAKGIDAAVVHVHEWLSKHDTPLRGIMSILAGDGLSFAAHAADKTLHGWIGGGAAVEAAKSAALARGHGAASSTTSAQKHDDAAGLFSRAFRRYSTAEHSTAQHSTGREEQDSTAQHSTAKDSKGLEKQDRTGQHKTALTHRRPPQISLSYMSTTT